MDSPTGPRSSLATVTSRRRIVALAVASAVITGLGLVLIPAPGPGFLVVALGATLLAAAGIAWLRTAR
jgi:hypothetical protein